MDYYDDGYGARDLNSNNPSLLSSLLAKLANIDEILKRLRENMQDSKNRTGICDQSKKEMNDYMIAQMQKIREELNAKLHNIMENLKTHQINQRSEGLKLQQEISHLKKEKLQLLQQMTDISKRINDMENIIGYDVK